MTQTEPKSNRFLCLFPHSEFSSKENLFQSQTGPVKIKLAPNCSPRSQVCKKSLGIYQQFDRPVEKAARRRVERRVFIWRPAWGGNFCLPASVIETAVVRSACLPLVLARGVKRGCLSRPRAKLLPENVAGRQLSQHSGQPVVPSFPSRALPLYLPPPSLSVFPRLFDRSS